MGMFRAGSTACFPSHTWLLAAAGGHWQVEESRSQPKLTLAELKQKIQSEYPKAHLTWPLEVVHRAAMPTLPPRVMLKPSPWAQRSGSRPTNTSSPLCKRKKVGFVTTKTLGVKDSDPFLKVNNPLMVYLCGLPAPDQAFPAVAPPRSQVQQLSLFGTQHTAVLQCCFMQGVGDALKACFEGHSFEGHSRTGTTQEIRTRTMSPLQPQIQTGKTLCCCMTGKPSPIIITIIIH